MLAKYFRNFPVFRLAKVSLLPSFMAIRSSNWSGQCVARAMDFELDERTIRVLEETEREYKRRKVDLSNSLLLMYGKPSE